MGAPLRRVCELADGTSLRSSLRSSLTSSLTSLLLEAATTMVVVYEAHEDATGKGAA